MLVRVRATTTDPFKQTSAVKIFTGDGQDLIDWIRDINKDADPSKVVANLFNYGVADSGWTRFRVL